jgi:hypothetical protein
VETVLVPTSTCVPNNPSFHHQGDGGRGDVWTVTPDGEESMASQRSFFKPSPRLFTLYSSSTILGARRAPTVYQNNESSADCIIARACAAA